VTPEKAGYFITTHGSGWIYRLLPASCAATAATVGYVTGDLDAVIAWLIAEGYLRPSQVAYCHTKETA
jgi:hypothetical protein